MYKIMGALYKNKEKFGQAGFAKLKIETLTKRKSIFLWKYW